MIDGSKGTRGPHSGGILDPLNADARVVVTAFVCPNRIAWLRILFEHLSIKRRLRASDIGGLALTTLVVSWRSKRILNISIWESKDAIYNMNGWPEHIKAAHLPPRLRVRTWCIVYETEGNWRDVLFPPEAFGKDRGSM